MSLNVAKAVRNKTYWCVLLKCGGNVGLMEIVLWNYEGTVGAGSIVSLNWLDKGAQQAK